MQSVNYKLHWIRLVDSEGKLIVKEEFNKIFGTEEFVLRFVESYRIEHSNLYGIKLEDAPFYQQVAKEEIIKDIIGHVSMYTGIKRDAILSKLGDHEITDARKIIAGISSELGLTPSQIHKMTGFDRGGIYTQIRRCKEMIETDKDFRNTYNKILEIIIS